jgi:Fic family protein
MWKPNYKITPLIAHALINLEKLRHEINDLPMTPSVLSSLRESARLSSIHYSTMIEGNKLTPQEIIKTIKEQKELPGKKRDQYEILGYYAALDEVELLIRKKNLLTEEVVKKIHALIMGGGKRNVKPTPYRTVQNAIYESSSGRIVYLPPEPKDVPLLMKDLIDWINKNPENLSCPLVAAMAHYQFATIHPYIDGNGRTARLLTTLILHACGYDLKGIYSLDEYYAKNLAAYYQALSIGPHNYYMGREHADITSWLEYFFLGMVDSFERVKNQALQASRQGIKDVAHVLRKLDSRQRNVLTLFQKHALITSIDVANVLNLQPRTARALCQKWVEEGFLIIADQAKKSRKYRLAPAYEDVLIQ